MIEIYNAVITLVKKKSFPKGSLGIVIEHYHNPDGYEIELQDETGYPIDVCTYYADEVQEISDDEYLIRIHKK